MSSFHLIRSLTSLHAQSRRQCSVVSFAPGHIPFAMHPLQPPFMMNSAADPVALAATLGFAQKVGCSKSFHIFEVVSPISRENPREGWLLRASLPPTASRPPQLEAERGRRSSLSIAHPGASAPGRAANPGAACSGATIIDLGLPLAPSSWRGAARLDGSGERVGRRALVRDS